MIEATNERTFFSSLPILHALAPRPNITHTHTYAHTHTH